ncbi:LLM class flavin-dependent oxidoreductase [Streptomyces sp. NPDC052496]|uniref:LLM class flavin-dependent oxidoreductase n=1 Tax=Streptomyces sp. NPDC052496 TaxID=3154951 RepID=UPI0034285E1E
MTFFPDTAVPPGRLAVGVVLPSRAVRRAQRLGLAAAARHAEQAGLDLVSHRHRPAPGEPPPDAAAALAAVAAATDHITVVSEACAPRLPSPDRTAEQLAGLQRIAHGRLVLGVGADSGPTPRAAAGIPYEPHGPYDLCSPHNPYDPYDPYDPHDPYDPYDLHVPYDPHDPHEERERRTDAVLRLLPRMLAGERVPPPYAYGPGCAPAAPAAAVRVPPVWIAGGTHAAVRRAALLGDGWFPSPAPAAEVAEGTVHLAELTAALGRKPPVVAVGAVAALGTEPGLPGRADIAAGLAEAHGAPAGRYAEVPVTGGAREAAERLHSYCGAGVSRVLVGFAGGDWRRQVELLAEVRDLVR